MICLSRWKVGVKKMQVGGKSEVCKLVTTCTTKQPEVDMLHVLK